MLRKCDQFADICQICSTTDHTWPRDTPVMRFSAKCAFSICLGIRKSMEHNFESEKNYSWETEVGAPEAPHLGSRGLMVAIEIWFMCVWPYVETDSVVPTTKSCMGVAVKGVAHDTLSYIALATFTLVRRISSVTQYDNDGIGIQHAQYMITAREGSPGLSSRPKSRIR